SGRPGQELRRHHPTQRGLGGGLGEDGGVRTGGGPAGARRGVSLELHTLNTHRHTHTHTHTLPTAQFLSCLFTSSPLSFLSPPPPPPPPDRKRTRLNYSHT